MSMENQYNAVLTDEAEIQLIELSPADREKILQAIRAFELIGKDYKNINSLGDKLYEIKPKGVRAYFMYHPKQQKIIIVGFITLKKSQKAPERYMAKARKNIENYLLKEV